MLEQSVINSLREDVIPPQKVLIEGAFVPSQRGKTLDVISPIDGKRLTTIPDCDADDVDRAVAAARASFEKGVWARLHPQERKRILFRLADLIEKNAAELAVLGSRDNGTEVGFALLAEPGSAASTFRFYAEAIDKDNGEITPSAPSILSLIHKEPVGVVGAIVPWNFPLMIGAWKLAPALAAGNSVVLKPSEDASLTLLRLGELALEAGLPNGVLNIVTGQGAVSGEAMGLHHDIDVIAFTGSGIVGRKLLEYSARSNLKRVYLELGGKSPNIVFADCSDVGSVARASVMAMFRNSGQVCVAPSRLLVEASIHDAFLDEAAKVAASLKVGDPLDLANQIGAIASQRQFEKDLAYIKDAHQSGVALVTGGEPLHQETGGYYLSPAIFDNPPQGSPLVTEEVFGPVLAVTTFKTEEEAIKMANDTPYGLSAGVWTENLSRAHRMIGAIRAGVVHVNCYGGADITVPLGGHKQSGNGHDRSIHALDKYQNLKTGWISLAR